MSKIEKAVTWAIGIANDNSHGYSQSTRWGPSYDCSSLVIAAYEQAGVPVKTMGATYTGNMRQIFKRAGFVEVGRPYRRGDVLLNEASHTAMMISPTQLVHASSSFGTTDTADNNGREIRTQNFYDFPWDCVLRYTGEDDEPESSDSDTSDQEPDSSPVVIDKEYTQVALPVLRIGSYGPAVEALQYLLNRYGYPAAGSHKRDGSWDGELGTGTESALQAFQVDKCISPCEIGTTGPETWSALLGE